MAATSNGQARVYEAVIKVLLADEYGWSAERIADLLERVRDDVADQEERRGE